MNRRRWLVGWALMALCASAEANGAMGLGMEMFDLRYWFAYVVAMVALEAWLIGRWLNLRWSASLGVSLLANFMTAVFCGGMGLCAPLLHQTFVGTRADPNPFMNAVALLAGLALPSAIVEAAIWDRAAKGERMGKILLRSMLVHAIMVPVGLAILLIPERPYRGLSWNRHQLRFEIVRALEAYVADKEAIPSQAEPRKLLEELEPYLRNPREELIYAFYELDPTRFSTGETWRTPVQVNRAILGKKLNPLDTGPSEDWRWFMRTSNPASGYRWGIVVDLNGGTVAATTEELPLGYK